MQQAEVESIAVNLFTKMGLVSKGSISTHTFKINDYVYCYDEEVGHIPCSVKDVQGNILILSDGFEIFKANASDCKFQDEED